MSNITLLTDADRAAVHELLRASGLPVLGFDDPHVVALVGKRDNGEVVGSAAIEMYGAAGLLRSVAVAEVERNQGLGKALMRAAIALAHDRGLTALFLLTETAPGFFPKFGFVPVARADIPAEVQTSAEFTTSCCASALAFQLSLKKGATRER